MNWKNIPGNHETWCHDAQTGDLISITKTVVPKCAEITTGIIESVFVKNEYTTFCFGEDADIFYFTVYRKFDPRLPFISSLKRKDN